MRADDRTNPADGPFDAEPSAGTMSSAIAAFAVAFATAQGVSIEEIARSTKVAPTLLADPEARLPDTMMTPLWDLILARIGADEAPPLQMATTAPTLALAGLDHGIRFAGTLRQALELMVDNRVVVADRVQSGVEEIGDRVEFWAWHPTDGHDQGRTLMAGFALLWRMLRDELEGPASLLRVEFAHGPCGAPERYERYFAAPVRFEARHSALVFPRTLMDRPLQHANAALFPVVQSHFHTLRQRLRKGVPETAEAALVDAVQACADRGRFDVGTVAGEAGLSLRAAQRLAARSGRSLRAMVDAARADRARELMADPALDLGSIAAILGYSDERAFRRAFKRWTGQAPAAFRRSL